MGKGGVIHMIERDQKACGICAAAAHTGGKGDAFLYGDLCTARDAAFRKEQTGSFVGCILLLRDTGAIYGKYGCRAHSQGVVQADTLHDGIHIVITVIQYSQYIQAEIDLGTDVDRQFHGILR